MASRLEAGGLRTQRAAALAWDDPEAEARSSRTLCRATPRNKSWEGARTVASGICQRRADETTLAASKKKVVADSEQCSRSAPRFDTPHVCVFVDGLSRSLVMPFVLRNWR